MLVHNTLNENEQVIYRIVQEMIVWNKATVQNVSS